MRFEPSLEVLLEHFFRTDLEVHLWRYTTDEETDGEYVENWTVESLEEMKEDLADVRPTEDLKDNIIYMGIGMNDESRGCVGQFAMEINKDGVFSLIRLDDETVSLERLVNMIQGNLGARDNA